MSELDGAAVVEAVVCHTVCFRWNPDVTPEDVRAIGEELDSLSTVPGLLALVHGPDLGLRPGLSDYAVVAFIAGTDPLSFLAHPDHVRVANEIVLPRAASREVVQFDASAAWNGLHIPMEPQR